MPVPTRPPHALLIAEFLAASGFRAFPCGLTATTAFKSHRRESLWGRHRHLASSSDLRLRKCKAADRLPGALHFRLSLPTVRALVRNAMRFRRCL